MAKNNKVNMYEVKSHKEYLDKLNEISNKKRLIDSPYLSFNKNESPYSKDYVKEGTPINVSIYKEGIGKKAFYDFKWSKV